VAADELQREIDDGTVFWGDEDGGELLGVMGIQPAWRGSDVFCVFPE